MDVFILTVIAAVTDPITKTKKIKRNERIKSLLFLSLLKIK